MLGMDTAQTVLRRASRNLGRHMGEQLRLRVEGSGRPLDIENLLKWRPGAPEGLGGMKGDSNWSPYYVSSDVVNCPNWDIYKLLCPREVAILTCEEVHAAMHQAYNPDIELWFPALLPRGEAKCVFKWKMSFEAVDRSAELARLYRQKAEREDRDLGEPPSGPFDSAWYYRDLIGLVAHKYHFPIDELLRTANEEQVIDLARRAMKKWGTWRGKVMRQEHQKRELPLNVETFITYSDHPAAGDAWLAENVVLTPTEHTKDVTRSALSSAFEEFGTSRFALPFFEEAMPAQAEAYSPNIKVTIPYLMERGDQISRFYYQMEG